VASKSLNFNLFGNDRTATKAIKGLGTQADILGKGFAKLGAVIASAFAVTKIVNFARTTVTEFAAAQDSQNRLSFAFSKFPALAGANADALRELNTQLQRKTKFDDDAFAAGQSTLAQYGLTEKQLKDITPLLADFAAKTGTDLPTAAEQLGKAILGQGRALKAVGIDFVDTGSAAGNFEQIMAGLRSQVGGFAESEGATFVGQLEILKNGFGEIKEKIGGLFAPALTLISKTIYENVLPALDRLVEKIGPTLKTFFERGAVVLGNFFDAISKAADEGSMKPILDFFDGLTGAAPVFSILETLGRVLGPIMPILADGLRQVGDTLQQEGVLDSISELIVDLLPTLVDLLIAAAPLIPPIADFLSGVLVPALQLAAGNIGMVSVAIELLKGNLNPAEFMRALEALPGIGGAFKILGDSIVNITNTVAGAFNGLIGAIEGAVNGVRFLMGMGTIKLPRVATISTAAWRVPDMGPASAADLKYRPFAAASGALVRATPGGSFGVVGEGGNDEAVLPLTNDVFDRIGAGISKSGGGGNITIEAHGVDPHTVTQMIYQRLSSRLAVI